MKVTIKHCLVARYVFVYMEDVLYYVGCSYFCHICIIGFCVVFCCCNIFNSIYKKYNSINMRHKYEQHTFVKGGQVEVIYLCMSNSFITSIFWFYDFFSFYIHNFNVTTTEWGITFFNLQKCLDLLFLRLGKRTRKHIIHIHR